MISGRLCRRSVLVAAAGLSVGMGIGQRAGNARAATAYRYLMTAFTNSSDSDLYVYQSSDATTFSLLCGPAYRPPAGLVRDPSLFRHTDGAYYITYTTAVDAHTIGFARSTDLCTWTYLYDYPIPLPGIKAAWAPTWYIDPSGRVYVIVSVTNGHFFLPYLLAACDTGLRSWTLPTPLFGITPAPRSLGYIDTTVVFSGGLFHAFTKNESTKYIELAVAETVLGPYRFIRTGDWAGWGAPREGQCVIRMPDGGWRIYFDAYTERKYFYSDSHDGFRTWTRPRELPGLSGTVRHVTVLPEPL